MDQHNARIQTNEVLLKENDDWLYFNTPYCIIQADFVGDVLPALREIEDLVKTKDWYAAGFLSYEAASVFESSLITHTSTSFINEHSSLRSAREGFPFLWFGLYPQPRLISLPEPAQPKETLSWLPTIDRDSYNAAFEQIKSHIAAGQTYQVNYTMRLHTEFKFDPWNFFLHLAQTQNNHAAYIDIGRYVICSASPELFFQLDGEIITCRPMKGTIRRGRTTLEDIEQVRALKESEKNRAENVMIVDMIRNDLGRIAKVGSVHVPELFRVEKYPTLWQMTSTVTARTNASLTDIFKALFPCASITGAPKVSTMRIISELERTPRRIYTGSIGYIAPNRKAKFNVAIRTALIDHETQTAEYGVGGGIVWDSVSQDEYAEATLKAQVLTDEHPQFSLVETMLWTPEGEYFLREKHIARLLDSANYFNFPKVLRAERSRSDSVGEVEAHYPTSRPPISRENIDTILDQLAFSFTTPQRVRLLVDRHGNIQTEHTPYQAMDKPLYVCLAKEPINSNDVFLFHKTTHREVYNRVIHSAGASRSIPVGKPQQEHRRYDDVMLYNERNELTEFTIGNLVVDMDGKLYTPPVDCGLLAGIFRAHLLETGQVVERIIKVEKLRNCSKVFLVNSVRQWQKIILK